MAKSKSGKMRKAEEKKNSLRCKCKFPLTEANYSTVRQMFFCPQCGQDISKEELENLMWGIPQYSLEEK